MRVADARVAAVDWLRSQRGQLDGLVGAYLGGSLAGLDGDAVVPDASDVDVMVVLTDPPPAKLGKFRHQGALLEVTYVDSIAVSDPETVLADYHLAGPFRYPSAILLDDQGALRSVQAAVAVGFGHRRWAERRARHAYDRARNGLLQLDTALDPPSLHLAWLFPTGVTTHVLLSAALRNPTIRLRYLRAREALDAHGRGDAYPELLAQLGVEQLTQRQVRHHLHSMAKAFDAAAAVLSRPASTRSRGLPFTSDLTPAARPVAVDGAAERRCSGSLPRSPAAIGCSRRTIPTSGRATTARSKRSATTSAWVRPTPTGSGLTKHSAIYRPCGGWPRRS